MAEDTPTALYVVGGLFGAWALYIVGGLFGAWALYMGYAHGKAPLKLHDVSLERHPFWFWLLMGLYGFAAFGSLYGPVFG